MNTQAFNNAIYQDIEMVRGDTMTFNFQLKGLGDTEASFYFDVTSNPADDPIFEVDNNNGIALEEHIEFNDLRTYSVTVAPNCTKDLDLGRYYYDLKMVTDTDVITLMRGRLELLYEIKRGLNDE